jgi:hypothetical protein
MHRVTYSSNDVLIRVTRASFSFILENHFMDQQTDINSPMRTILVDWLIEVADEYKLHDETLFLSVQYIDRFLSTVNVTRSKLQLLGSLFILSLIKLY